MDISQLLNKAPQERPLGLLSRRLRKLRRVHDAVGLRNATLADKYARAGNEFGHFRGAFATERASKLLTPEHDLLSTRALR